MPVTKTTVPIDYYGYIHGRQGDALTISCYPWTTLASSTIGPFDSYYKQYNNVDHRVKPDPLTDTALPIQHTTRRRLSVVDWFIYNSAPAYCAPNNGQIIYYTTGKSMFEVSTGIYQETDWNQKTIQHVGKKLVNLASSVAEYRETATMFAYWAKTVAKAWTTYRDTKRLKLFPGKITPCSIAAAELAYSYGVRPLTEDLFSVAESLKLKLGMPIWVPHESQSRVNSSRDVRSTPWDMSQHSYAIEKEMVTDRVKLSIEIEPDGATNIVIGNPIQWAWELIPFSFVVDWGIPIGQWLEDIDTLKRIALVKGTRTRKVQKVVYFKTQFRKADNSFFTDATLGKTSYKSHERMLVTSLSFPSVPRWNPSASYYKVYRAVSLLIAVNQPCRRYSGRSRRRSARL